MIGSYIYFFFLLLELLFLVVMIIYYLSHIFSNFSGAMYVPTKQKEAYNFLKEAHLKKGQVFLELGSGDGRVVRTAVKQYNVKGIGIDINPVLIFTSKMFARFQHLQNVTFQVGNVLTADVSKADVIYLFLLPDLINKISSRIVKQTKKNCIIISHGFAVKGWDKYLYKTLPGKPFRTFFYKIP